MKIKFDKDYYTDGIAKGLSCYENYRWIPELTYPMAHAFFNFLRLKKKSNVLEFGCAHGFLIKCLIDFGVNAYGVDISDYAIKNCHVDINKRLALIKNNNLSNLFDHLFSIEQVKVYKPDSKVYEIPVKKYNVKPNEITFLSANTWDVSGGGNYGYNAVWVNRNKSQFDNLDYHPKNEIGNLSQLLDKI